VRINSIFIGQLDAFMLGQVSLNFLRLTSHQIIMQHISFDQLSLVFFTTALFCKDYPRSRIQIDEKYADDVAN